MDSRRRDHQARGESKKIRKIKTHVKEIIRSVEEVSAGLDDADKGNDEKRH